MKHTLLNFIGCWLVMTSLAQSTVPGPKKGNSGTTSHQYTTHGKKVIVYTTAAQSNLKLSKSPEPIQFESLPQPFETQIAVFVDPAKTFQTYIGVGAAITDAAAETLYKLPSAKQQELLRAYFDSASGIGYQIIRTNINSCDFSSDMYTYVADHDQSLASFSIKHDLAYKIPFIKEAFKVAGRKLVFYASPWSPPAWMKDNNNMLRGGKLKRDYYNTWALYYTKFIKAYEKEGIPVWGITIQNEPMAVQSWESCVFTAEEERDFLKFHLGPTMHRQGLANKKIVMWDHNRDLLYQRAQTYFKDPLVNKFAWGIGLHWYENWSGGENMFNNVALVNRAFPDKHILFTEGCQEKFTANTYDRWDLGERYAKNMIFDFNNGAVGWTDWNILLDERGGPNHVGNYCYAPVHGNTQTGELFYTNAYYYIGHFSKFIQPGARLITASASRSQLLSTAFINPNQSITTVVLNLSDSEIPYFLWINGQAASIKIPPHAIQTAIIQ